MIKMRDGAPPAEDGAPSCPENEAGQSYVTKRGRRGTSNRDARGNTRDRAARRAFLLAKFGNGVTAPCYRFEVCGAVLDDTTITVDRIVPGCQGGRYTRGNIRPACGPCNSETGGSVRSA